MLDGILNNRKEWNAKKEEYEAKVKAIEEQKAAKAPAAAGKREARFRMNVSMIRETLFTSHLIPALFIVSI